MSIASCWSPATITPPARGASTSARNTSVAASGPPRGCCTRPVLQRRKLVAQSRRPENCLHGMDQNPDLSVRDLAHVGVAAHRPQVYLEVPAGHGAGRIVPGDERPGPGAAAADDPRRSGFASAPESAFVRFAAYLVGLALLKGIFQYWMRVILIGISRDIEFDLRNDLFAPPDSPLARILRSYAYRRHHGARHQRPQRRAHDAGSRRDVLV